MPVQAKEASQEKIIFVPHDNRPISDMQTADTVRRLGYDVVVPPDNQIDAQRQDMSEKTNTMTTWWKPVRITRVYLQNPVDSFSFK